MLTAKTEKPKQTIGPASVKAKPAIQHAGLQSAIPAPVQPPVIFPSQPPAQLFPPGISNVAQLTRFGVPSYQKIEEEGPSSSNAVPSNKLRLRRILVEKDISAMEASDLAWLARNVLNRLGEEELNQVLMEVFTRILELLSGVAQDLAREDHEPDIHEAETVVEAGNAVLDFVQTIMPREEIGYAPPPFVFRWPQALFENVIRRLPGRLKISNTILTYQYDEEGGLSVQPEEGREMRKRESLISRGAWKDEESRKEYELSLAGGILTDKKGNALNGNIQYVLSADWKLYGQEAGALEAERQKYGRSSDVHTRYLAGGPARSAGWLVVQNGTIVRVGNDSGHYGPNRFMLLQLLELMRSHGVQLEGMVFHDEASGTAHNAQEMYDWMMQGAVEKEPKGKKSKGL